MVLAFFPAIGGEAFAKDGHAGESEIPNPCASLLAILDRPTVSDSACAAPLGHAVLELGYEHASVRGEGGGTAGNYPEAEARVGLPGSNEFKVLLPNYNSQRTPGGASSGFSATAVGFKHEIGYTSRWLGSVEALLTLPSGNYAYGSRGLGIALNGIAAYSLTDQIGLSLLAGLSSQTAPELAGGGRFTSFNTDIVATWQPLERLQFYGEVFGQTKTGPGQGAGYDFDGGVQYLVARRLEIDAEEGVRLSGGLGGFTHYTGAGAGLLF